MCFCFIFCPFLGELPCILGRLPFIFFGGFLVYSLVKSNKYKILILKITKK